MSSSSDNVTLCTDCKKPLKNQKYDKCFKCVFKKCTVCNRYTVKKSSGYGICYGCNTQVNKTTNQQPYRFRST